MKRFDWIIGLAALWATGTAGGQTTWYVADLNCNQGSGSGTQADPFCNIQLGIDAASGGDEVVLAEGQYHEAINLLGKAITVRSTDPLDPAVVAATVIDGFHLNTSVITCESGEGADTVLNGLTFTRGNPTNGGGMSNINGSSPTVMNCTFSDNEAIGGSAKGGGMYNDGSSPTVTGCTFSGNTSDYLAAGMYNGNGSSPIVTDCTFSNNEAGPAGGGMYNDSSNPTVTGCTFSGNHGTGGGGMQNVSGSDPTVSDCTFSGNSATSGGGMDFNYSGGTVTDCTFSGNSATSGGGISSHESNLTVTNCLFAGNVVTTGGGMSLNYTDATVTNCTFSDNAATGGGGMNIHDGTATLTNCVLWGNSGSFPGVYEIIEHGSTTTVSFSDVWGGLPAGLIDGGGNVDVDPLFNDASNGDYRLAADSPCIDAADNTAVPAGVTTDRDGNPRFVDDPDTPDGGNGEAPIVDMGAYEFQVAGCDPCDMNCDGTTDAADIESFIDILFNGATPCGTCTGDTNSDGFIDAADIEGFINCLFP